MCCVGNDNDLREVTLGKDGAFQAVAKGAIFVDHTTASAEIARELYAAATKGGFGFIDGPVSGGQAGAENGVLTVMCGGDASHFRQGQAGDRCLCARLQPVGRGRLRPARQDVQPDLHRRPGSGPVRSAAFRQEGRPRHRKADRDHLERRGAILADGKPLQDHGRRQIRPRLRGRLDAQGPEHLPRRSAQESAPASPSPRWSISSTRKCRRWAASAGIRRR